MTYMRTKIGRQWPRCGAKTRAGGVCQRTPILVERVVDGVLKLVVRNGRCRNHGGLCTGPKGKRKKTA